MLAEQICHQEGSKFKINYQICQYRGISGRVTRLQIFGVWTPNIMSGNYQKKLRNVILACPVLQTFNFEASQKLPTLVLYTALIVNSL